jgi:hypothetical protein
LASQAALLFLAAWAGASPAAPPAPEGAPRTVVVAGISRSQVLGGRTAAEVGLATIVARLRERNYVIRARHPVVFAFAPDLWPEANLEAGAAFLEAVARRTAAGGMVDLAEEKDHLARLSRYWEMRDGTVVPENAAIGVEIRVRAVIESGGRSLAVATPWAQPPPAVRQALEARPLLASRLTAAERARMHARNPAGIAPAPLAVLNFEVYGEHWSDPGRRSELIGQGMRKVAEEMGPFRERMTIARERIVEAAAPERVRALPAGPLADSAELPEAVRLELEGVLARLAGDLGFADAAEARRFLGAAAAISVEKEVRLIGLLADPAAPGGWREVALELPLP